MSKEMRHDGVLPMEDKLAKSKSNFRVEVEKKTAVGLERGGLGDEMKL